MTITELTTTGEFDKFLGSGPFTVVHFFAPWAVQCEAMNGVMEELSGQPAYKSVRFGKCEAEELSDISLRYKVSAVPTVIIYTNGRVCETIEGAKAADLNAKLSKVVGQLPSAAGGEEGSLTDRLKSLIKKRPVMVFMKGSPQQPRCGFSRTLVGILNETKIPYDTFDILQDEDVRQGLKEFSNWPTYPQIYVNGELIGGLDIIQELKENGELSSTLQP